jgi:DNA-binding cell septation regulator SpoVG
MDVPVNIRVSRVTLVNNDKNLKAFVDVTIKSVFTITVFNCRVWNGSKGLFVTLPQEPSRNKGKKVKYYDLVHIKENEVRDLLNSKALEAYREESLKKPELPAAPAVN